MYFDTTAAQQFIETHQTILLAWIVREMHVWYPKVWGFIWETGLRNVISRIWNGPVSTKSIASIPQLITASV